MQNLLFGVCALDAWAFGLAPSAIAGVAVIGCGIPAWRAARLDPIVTLKLE